MNNGIYTDISNDAYHGDKGSLSTSQIKKMANTYAHAKYALDNPSEQTAAMLLGTIFHALTLENGEGIAVIPDVNKRTKAGQQTIKDWEAINQGNVLCSQEVFDAANEMMESTYKHPTARQLLEYGQAESSIFWDHEGQQLRCRPDFLNTEEVCVDLKSAIDASPDGFAKAVSNFGYDLQQAIYEDGINTQRPLKDFVFVVTENKPPYLTAVYRLKGEDVARARMKYNRLLAGWKACKEFDYYSGYSDDIIEISLPPWHK